MSIVPPDYQSVKISQIGIASQFGLNLTLGFGTLVLFSFLRPRNSTIYSPKQFAPGDKQPPKIEENKLWGWVKPVLKADESSLIKKIGLDAVMFIRFIRLCRNVSLCLFVFGACIIMPINFFGTYRDNNNDVPVKENPLQILSVSYLKQANWFWAHSVFTWLFSLILYWFIYREYSNYKRLRIGYFKSEEYRKSVHSRTLLITGLPHSKQSDRGLIEFMESIKVEIPIFETVIGRDPGILPVKIAERETAVYGLESALVKYLKGPNNIADKRPQHRIRGKKEDSINIYTNKIETSEANINALRKKLTDRRKMSYGFVAFENIHYAHSVARQLDNVPSGSIAHKSLNAPAVQLAPMPKDIIWSSLTMIPAVRSTQRWIGRFFFIALCFLWLIPLGFIVAAGQIQNIVKAFPFLKGLLYQHNFIAGLIESWMTPLILAAFVIVLPIILRVLTRAQGIITYSGTEKSVLGKLYLFFFLNNLIIYTITSTLWDIGAKIKASIDAGLDLNDLKKVIFHSKFLDEIAESVIKVSFFWINYISLSGLVAIWDLAQIFQLVYVWFKKKIISPTPRNLRELSAPPEFDYPVYYTIHLFFFTLGILYSVIAPLILLFCYLYYAIAYLVYRYQLMYVFNTKIETGGTFWKTVFNRLIFAIIFWQLTMVGVMNLKGAHIQSVVVIPLIFITLLLKFVCSNRFDKTTRYYVPDPERAGKSSKDDKGKRKEQHIYDKFGHPAFTKKLIIPMIHANVKNLLKFVYHGRISETTELSGYGKSKTIVIEDGDFVLKIQPVEKNELYVFDDDDDFNMGYQSTSEKD